MGKPSETFEEDSIPLSILLSTTKLLHNSHNTATLSFPFTDFNYVVTQVTEKSSQRGVDFTHYKLLLARHFLFKCWFFIDNLMGLAMLVLRLDLSRLLRF